MLSAQQEAVAISVQRFLGPPEFDGPNNPRNDPREVHGIHEEFSFPTSSLPLTLLHRDLDLLLFSSLLRLFISGINMSRDT